MKFIALLSLILIAGCSTPVPMKPKFPIAPAQLTEPCPELKKLEKDVKLSDVAKTITENYTSYHECSIKNQAWIEWYNTQKKIFEDIK